MARWRSGALSYHDNLLPRPWGYSLTVLPSRRSYFGEQTLEHPPRDTSDKSGFSTPLGATSRGRDDVRARSSQRWAADLKVCRRSRLVGGVGRRSPGLPQPPQSTLLGHSASHSERLFLPPCGHCRTPPIDAAGMKRLSLWPFGGHDRRPNCARPAAWSHVRCIQGASGKPCAELPQKGQWQWNNRSAALQQGRECHGPRIAGQACDRDRR